MKLKTLPSTLKQNEMTCPANGLFPLQERAYENGISLNRVTKWREVYTVLQFEQPAGQQEEKQGTVCLGKDVSGGGNGKDTPGEERSDLCILLSWENELKGISSTSSQLKELLLFLETGHF